MGFKVQNCRQEKFPPIFGETSLLFSNKNFSTALDLKPSGFRPIKFGMNLKP